LAICRCAPDHTPYTTPTPIPDPEPDLASEGEVAVAQPKRLVAHVLQRQAREHRVAERMPAEEAALRRRAVDLGSGLGLGLGFGPELGLGLGFGL